MKLNNIQRVIIFLGMVALCLAVFVLPVKVTETKIILNPDYDPSKNFGSIYGRSSPYFEHRETKIDVNRTGLNAVVIMVVTTGLVLILKNRSA
jgi:hypothetical protein